MRLRLNDPLVTSFVYEEKEYDINLSFDNVLDVFDVLDIYYLNPFIKAHKCLEYLLGEGSFKAEQAIELWNYVFEEFIEIKSKQPIKYDLKGNPLPTKKQNKFIDFDKDAEYIFASFKHAYNMNLYREQGNLHWHEFQSLLNGLPADTQMQRIIQIRLWEPKKGDAAEYKKNMEELQEIYALDDEEEEEVNE